MPSLIEELAAKLAWELNSWRSIEIRSHQEFASDNPNPGPREFQSSKNEYVYIETALGQRFFERDIVPSNIKGSLNREYSDGKLAAGFYRDKDFDAERDQVTIKHVFSNEEIGQTSRPEPFCYLYVGLEPLNNALKEAQHLGPGRHIGRECEKFLFVNVSNGSTPLDIIYWLDRETAIPLKVEYFRHAKTGPDGKPHALWAAKSLDIVQGHPIALKSASVSYVLTGPDEGKSATRNEIVVDRVEYDKEYPASTFWPQLTPEISVIDRVRSTNYFPPVKGGDQAKAQAGVPIRAEVPTSGLFSASGIMMMAGALVLTVILVRTRRGT